MWGRVACGREGGIVGGVLSIRSLGLYLRAEGRSVGFHVRTHVYGLGLTLGYVFVVELLVKFGDVYLAVRYGRAAEKA